MKKHVIVDIKTTSNLHNEAVDKQLENYAAIMGGSCRLSGTETKITTIGQLKEFSDKKENECVDKIEIEAECVEQIKRLNEKAYDGFPLTESEREDLHTIDNLLERFKEEGTTLVCDGEVLNQ